ncbi:transposase [Candidatus Regiella insecticola]|uniref:transposase n=1 Tax=Candidatus Regiella insecticola TaxID=138073 RepID=UPI001F1E170F
MDESGFAQDRPRLYGYSPKGKRCYGKNDWLAKGRVNIIGALLEGTLIWHRWYKLMYNIEMIY